MTSIDFVADLLKEPQVDERFTRTHLEPQEIDKTVTAVIHHFASVWFSCGYTTHDTKCKARTHYLYLGNPRCLNHCRTEMETHSEQDIAQMRGTSETTTR